MKATRKKTESAPSGREVPGSPAVATTGQPGQAALSGAVRLLKIEGDLRQIRAPSEFSYFVANETRLVTRSQQTFALMRNRGKALKVEAVSAMSVVDPAAPLVCWVEALAAGISTKKGLQSIYEFDPDSIDFPKWMSRVGYPLRFMVWVPFLDLRGEIIGGLIQARATPWTDADLVVCGHIAGACAHTWMALSNGRSTWKAPFRFSLRRLMIVAALLVPVGFVPVSMSALAPVEVSPRNAFVVTAPAEGVVDRVLVAPNASVNKGDALIRMADTVLSNRLEVAEREVLVARAKLKKAEQMSFADSRGRHDLGVAHAELRLRQTERDYASNLLGRSVIKAEREGVALFSDVRDLIGRPVAVGERLMELANPQRLEFRVDLPVADAIVLRNGARVKVFLDSDPLRPIEARMIHADFSARMRGDKSLAFRLIAEMDPADKRELRLGARGTAQVYSDKVPLAFYVFRRPITAARQWLGI